MQNSRGPLRPDILAKVPLLFALLVLGLVHTGGVPATGPDGRACADARNAGDAGGDACADAVGSAADGAPPPLPADPSASGESAPAPALTANPADTQTAAPAAIPGPAVPPEAPAGSPAAALDAAAPGLTPAPADAAQAVPTDAPSALPPAASPDAPSGAQSGAAVAATPAPGVPDTRPTATPADEPLPPEGATTQATAAPPSAVAAGAPAAKPQPDPLPTPEPMVMAPVDAIAPPAVTPPPGPQLPALPLVIDPLPQAPRELPSWMTTAPRTLTRPGATAAQPADARADQSRLHAGLAWDQCGLRVRGRGRPGLGGLGTPAPTSGAPVAVAADQADYDRAADVVTLEGGVVIDQEKQHLESDRSRYDRKTGAVNAQGNVFLDYPGGRLLADQADYNLNTKTGRASVLSYRIASGINARGTAATAEILPAQRSRYRDVIYTTCPPGYSDWSIRASELELDQADGMGTARHARLRLGPVPVLYTPYLRFPIDDRRRSGFLVPIFGSSSNTGLDLTLPYYWNIAPNLDATISPRLMTDRGLMIGTEVRGLQPFGSFVFNGQILPRDEEEPDLGVRWGERITGTAARGRFASAIDYSAVSDDQFLTDFGNRLDVTSIRNLTQRGSLVYAGGNYSLTGWLQGFQTVDATTAAIYRPYAQLPHIQLDLAPQHWGPAEFTFQAHYDYFDNPARVYGNRAVLLPAVRVPLRRSYGFLIPRVRLYATGYQLINADAETDNTQSFLIPSLDLDAGLLFDRETSLFGHTALQTLEPRVYYVLTSYADQSQTPLFDTTALTFSYASLFRPNRFTGYDRVGDDNRLTVGLTSRTLSGSDGREWFRISLGQILYFNDRRVQLSDATADTSASSSLAGELSTNPAEGWLARASFQWDPNLSQNQWEQRVLQLRYTPGDDRMFNLTYRYSLGATEAERYENTDLSFYWPVTKRIGVVGRWLYSVLESDTVEAFAGIEFGRCCWRLRLLGRHLKTSATDPGSTGFMIQLELAGLGTIGDKVESLLQQGIYGYDSL